MRAACVHVRACACVRACMCSRVTHRPSIQSTNSTPSTEAKLSQQVISDTVTVTANQTGIQFVRTGVDEMRLTNMNRTGMRGCVL